MKKGDKEYQEYVQEFMDEGVGTGTIGQEIDDSFTKNSERGKHPNSQKAIKKYQFKKGESGNIMGRPKTFDKLAKALNKLGEEHTDDWIRNKDLGSRKSQVHKRIWDEAIGGDIKYVQILAQLGCLDD